MTPTHYVRARHPVTLATGAPASPGDRVTADPEKDAALIADGQLAPLPKRRRATRDQTSPDTGDSTTPSEEGSS